MLTIITSIFKEACVGKYVECSHLKLLFLPTQQLFILLSSARQKVIEVPKTPIYTSDQYVSRAAS